MRVTGVARFPSGSEGLVVAALRVSVRDVGEADAPAVPLVEAVLPDVPVPAGGADVPFSLDLPSASVPGAVPPVVRVHADVSGSGEVTVGDLVSTSAHPVRTAGRAVAQVVVPLDRVDG